MELNNCVALVTGGAHGIGRALCRALHMEGVRLAVADLDIECAEKVASEVNGLAVRLDVSQQQEIIAAVEHVEAELGPIDIFISNAGVAFGDGPDGAASAPDEHWQACLDINLMAHVYAARAMIPLMKGRGGGCLVNVVSAAGLLTQVGEAAYTASKHAAVGFAESLAITHGGDGIHVCLVCPQAVATRMIGVDEDSEVEDGSIGFGGNDVDGILSTEYVADCILAGIQEERFLVLPHPQVSTYFQRKADDHDRWISGMRRFRRRIKGQTNELQ
ncbi:MAG: SDR family NAD(P)-dependent oxidoreductase [Gammaproteobacteria bacterium]|nr:SDR family NAD(P)-dependent oxidoreductase [Gammaproteobacteria bacterium]